MYEIIGSDLRAICISDVDLERAIVDGPEPTAEERRKMKEAPATPIEGEATEKRKVVSNSAASSTRAPPEDVEKYRRLFP